MSTQGFVLNLLQIYKKMCGFKNLFLEISRLHLFLYASAMLPRTNDMVEKDRHPRRFNKGKINHQPILE